MDDISKISLTDDNDRKAKLERKLAEYKARRLAKQPIVDRDTMCKEIVLAELLEHGGVDVDELRSRMVEDPSFSEHVFINAVQVIAAYNGSHDGVLHGGTGLR